MKRNLSTLILSFLAIVSLQAEIVPGKYYKINSCSSGKKALFTANASLEENVEVIAWTETNVPAQRWMATAASDKLFYLFNAYSEKPLANSSRRPKAGDKLVLKSNEPEYSQWEFVPVSDPAFPHAYYIRFSKQMSNGDNLYLGLTDAMDGEFAELQLKAEGDRSLLQMWTVVAEELPTIQVSPALRDSVMQGWKNRYYTALKTSTGFWGEAEMMETILDAYETTGKEEYKKMFEEVYEHFVSYPAGWYQPGNGKDWSWNDFNDDIAWAVLASVRAYLLFGQHPNTNIDYLAIGKTNYDRMYSRALLPSGMLRWKEAPAGNQGSNSCINGPAAVAACYLAIASKDDSYYEKAKNLYTLQRKYLYEPATGKVFDSGSWKDGVFTVGNRWVSTYNQGTFLGAALMLYNRYGTVDYKNDADKIVEWTHKDLCNAHGVIRVCGSGDDLQGFKGILMRYLRRYVVDLAVPEKVEWLQRNALQAYNNRNSKGVIWTAWWEKSSENFIYSDGYNFADKLFGCSTAVSAAFNAPIDKDLIIKDGFKTIEAEHFDYLKGVFVEQNEEAAYVGNTGTGHFTAYHNVHFAAEKATGVEFLVEGSRQSGRQIEIRLDSPSGELLGTAEIPTLDKAGWTRVSCPITSIDQVQNIYLVYKGSGFKLNSFCFTKKTSGIKDPASASQLKLYPSPAVSELNVNAPYAGFLSVYNALGKKVEVVNVPEGKTTMNVSSYGAGAYIVCLRAIEGIFTARFLKE